jgi:hypothetical protein
METITTKTGLQRKKLQLVYEEITSDKLVSYLKPKLKAFVRNSWQNGRMNNSELV